MSIEEALLQQARSAQGDELWRFLHLSHPQIIEDAILNRNLSVDMAIFVAKRRNVPIEVLGLLANDIRFKDSLRLKIALCRNPKTPQRIVFGLLKFLPIFDLGDLSRNVTIPIAVRQKVELMITEKAATLPSGVKSALAKRASVNVILFLLEHGERSVIEACLDSPAVTEARLCTLISKKLINSVCIRLISQHPKWSLRYPIRYALLRNLHAPLTHVVRFISEMKTCDLRELYAYDCLSSSLRPYIHSELRLRSESMCHAKDDASGVTEEDDIA